MGYLALQTGRSIPKSQAMLLIQYHHTCKTGSDPEDALAGHIFPADPMSPHDWFQIWRPVLTDPEQMGALRLPGLAGGLLGGCNLVYSEFILTAPFCVAEMSTDDPSEPHQQSEDWCSQMFWRITQTLPPLSNQKTVDHLQFFVFLEQWSTPLQKRFH